MVLGKLAVPGRPTIWITVGQGPTALAVGAGGGCMDIFTLIYPFFPLSPSLWETARYRLKYCLKGPLNPKPTNQPTCSQQSQKVTLRPNNLYHFVSVAEIAVVIRLRLSETRKKRENADKSVHITCSIIVCTNCGNSIIPKTGFGETRPKYICAAL